MFYHSNAHTLDPIKKLLVFIELPFQLIVARVWSICCGSFNQQSIAYHQGDLTANPYQCSPYIGEIDQDGYSVEEKNDERESKIWQDDNLDIEATAVRFQVFTVMESLFVLKLRMKLI